jgi:hypothetical protein
MSLSEIMDEGMEAVVSASALVSMGLCVLADNPAAGIVVTMKGMEALERAFKRP